VAEGQSTSFIASPTAWRFPDVLLGTYRLVRIGNDPIIWAYYNGRGNA
jgi:hypothetical protein